VSSNNQLLKLVCKFRLTCDLFVIGPHLHPSLRYWLLMLWSLNNVAWLFDAAGLLRSDPYHSRHSGMSVSNLLVCRIRKMLSDF
jgi:hypothetical protein